MTNPTELAKLPATEGHIERAKEAVRAHTARQDDLNILLASNPTRGQVVEFTESVYAEAAAKQLDLSINAAAEQLDQRFATFDVVSTKTNLGLSLFTLQPRGSASVTSRSIRVSEVTSYESVPAYEHDGNPHARLTLRNGEVVYVKQHVTTVAERLGHAAKTGC